MSGIDAVHDLERQMLEGDEDGAYAYLLESWVASCVANLREARRREGLTQEDIAERLNTKQPAIARLEKDHEGRFSLRRFAEYALACGLLPLDVPLKPAEEVRGYALNDPVAPRTEVSVKGWSKELLASSYANAADCRINIRPRIWTFVDGEMLHEGPGLWTQEGLATSFEELLASCRGASKNAITVQQPEEAQAEKATRGKTGAMRDVSGFRAPTAA